MMAVLLVLLYLCIGAIVTFADGYIAVGVFWIVAAPFAFAVFFAKYGEKLKKRGKAE